MYIVDERRAIGVVVHDGEHVNVSDGMAHNLTFGAEILYKQVLLLQLLRFLKLQFGCFLLHLLEHMLRELARVALQNLPCLRYRRLVILQRLLSAAWCFAVVYVILQARLVFTLFDAFFRYYLAARAWLV